MSRQLHCPRTECGHSFAVTEAQPGQTISCPHCGHPWMLDVEPAVTRIVPAGDAPASPSPAVDGVAETRVIPDQPAATLPEPAPAAPAVTVIDPAHAAPTPPAEPTPTPLPAHIGRFEIREELGRGGFGIVYRAWDPKMKREVALKVARPGTLDTPERVRRFLGEAEAAGKLTHPNIVPVFDADRLGEQYYIASAFIPGHTLAAELAHRAEGSPVDYRQAAQAVRHLAEALAYAHGEGVIHRDVKPGNVMVNTRGVPMLMDFGLARLSEQEEKLTQDGQGMGTPPYMAPEQALGKAQAASDQYSLGCTLYELLAGHTPFAGSSPAHYAFLHQTQEPPRPRKLNPQIPLDLETICLKCLEKEADKRYGHCQELADDLRRFLDDEPIQARRIGPAERLRRWCRKNPLSASLMGTVAATLILGATIAGYFAWESGQNAELFRLEAITSKRNEDTAKKERTDAIMARNSLRKTTTQLQTSVARSLLRPLAVKETKPWNPGEVDPLVALEIESLWELAGYQNTDLGVRFVEVALLRPTTTRQLKDRAKFALHAAVGLNVQNRQRVEELLYSQLASREMSEDQRLNLALVLLTLGDCAPTTGKLAAGVLAQAMSSTDSSVQIALVELAEVLAIGAARLEPKEGGVVCAQAANTLIKAMTTTKVLRVLQRQARALASVAACLESEAAAQVAATLAKVMSTKGDTDSLRVLAQTLGRVADRMERRTASLVSAQAANTLTRVVTTINRPTPFMLRDLSQGLASVAPHMEPKMAAETLIRAMHTITDPSALTDLTKCLVGVAGRLEPEAASVPCAQAAAVLTKALNTTKVPDEVAEGLASMAAYLEPEAASVVCAQAAITLTQALSTTKAFDELRRLAQGLSSVTVRMNAKAAVQVAKTLTQALRTTKVPGALPHLARSLTSVAARLDSREASAACAQAAETLTQAITTDLTKVKPTDRFAVLLYGSQGLTSVASYMEPKASAQVAATLTQAMTNTTSPSALALLAEGLASVTARMEPEAAFGACREAAATLTKAMTNTNPSHGQLRSWAEGVASVAAHMEPEAASALCAQTAATLAQALSTTKAPNELPHLVQCLSSVSAYIKANAAAQTAATLAQATSTTKAPNVLRHLAEGLASVAARMEPEAASAVCAQAAAVLTKVLSETRRDFDVSSLARGLASVATHMEAKAAGAVHIQVAAALTKAMRPTLPLDDPLDVVENPEGLEWTPADEGAVVAESLAPLLANVAACLEPKAADTACATAAAALTRIMSTQKAPSVLRKLTNCLEAILRREDAPRSAQRPRALAATVATLATKDTILLAPVQMRSVLEPPPLPPQTLVTMLKDPLCVGQARRLVLDQLERHYHRPFTDQWDFVRFAQQRNLGLDLTSPPQRPQALATDS